MSSDPELHQNLDPYITVVSGLPRSGTSMMMKMLDAGGLEVMTDDLRTADESNPKGYYELERVKMLNNGDNAWVPNAQGKVVKVISYLLEYLPVEYNYKIIFMNRDIGEVLSSQRRMLEREGKPDSGVSDEQMSVLYQKHLAKVQSWLSRQKNMEVIHVSYNDTLQTPQDTLELINRFLGGKLNTAAMQQAIDQSLYRERR
jgi:hypothetical protein